jgi:hypothetical protein
VLANINYDFVRVISTLRVCALNLAHGDGLSAVSWLRHFESLHIPAERAIRL